MRKSVLNFNNGQHLYSCRIIFSLTIKVNPLNQRSVPHLQNILKLKQCECESAVQACMISITIKETCHSDNLWWFHCSSINTSAVWIFFKPKHFNLLENGLHVYKCTYKQNAVAQLPHRFTICKAKLSDILWFEAKAMTKHLRSSECIYAGYTLYIYLYIECIYNIM